MRHIGKVLVAATVLLPAVAQAQRPSATMATRSAELYLDRAEKQQDPAEKAKLYQQASEMAQQGVEKDPGNSKTWFTLGRIHAAQGNAAAADSAFDKAESLWPEYTKEIEPFRMRAYITAFNNGVTAVQENRVQDAIAALEAAEAVYSAKPTAALNLGNLYAKAGDNEKAAVAFRRALVIMRSDEARKGLSEAEVKQWAQWEEAAAFNLGQVLATARKDDEAAQAYLDYLARNPGNSVARANLALVYTRMGKTEEATKVYADLLSKDLTDDEYFQVGIGLFRGNQHEQAAAAFRKAVEKNSAFRDAYYNLAQSLYEQTLALDDARSKAKPADAKSYDAKLKPLLMELQTVTEKARELDPNNRNILALLARTYRGMADIVGAAEATEWKNKTLKVMEAHRDLPVEITGVQVSNNGGEIKLAGNVVNLKATEGEPVKVEVSFLGKDGSVLGTQEVTVTAPKVEDQVEFSAAFKTDKPLGGWKYVVVK
jgi:tetratricopeptide (TPR) repeat protein